MRKIPKQEYTAEFKELAVKRVKDGQSAGAVAKDLGLIEQTLRNWVKAFDAEKLVLGTVPTAYTCFSANPVSGGSTGRPVSRRLPTLG